MLSNVIEFVSRIPLGRKEADLFRILKASAGCSISNGIDAFPPCGGLHLYKPALDAFFSSLFDLRFDTALTIQSSICMYLEKLLSAVKQEEQEINLRRKKDENAELLCLDDKIAFYLEQVEHGGPELERLKMLYGYHNETCEKVWEMLECTHRVLKKDLYNNFFGFDNIDLFIIDGDIEELIGVKMPRCYSGDCWCNMIVSASYYGAKEKLQF